MKGIVKNNFSQESFLNDFGPTSDVFLEALGAVILMFATLATGSKIDGVTGRNPIQCQTGGGGESHGIWSLQSITRSDCRRAISSFRIDDCCKATDFDR